LLKMNEVGPRHYRDAMARFGGAVHVVTTDGPAGRRGTTIIATCSVSDSPPTVLVCLNRENRSNDLFVENGRFALNTLPHEMQPLAEAFSGLTGLTQDERFALGEWEVLATGAPVLKGALAVFDCEIIEAVDHATHRVLFGKVTALKVGDRLRPLVYFDRAYRAL
jgi:cob(II)yrinic acid a,c-diamide reductase